MDWITFVPIIIALLVIGFFSGIEIAFISANKLSVELRKKQGSYSGRIWSIFLSKPARFIVTTLLITNILLVIYGLLWDGVLSVVWDYWAIDNPYIILAAEIIVAALILLFFQFTFKAFFRAKGNSVTSSGFLAFFVKSFYSLFSWLAKYFVDIAEWILKYIFNVKLQRKTEAFAKMDLAHYVQQLNMNDNDEHSEMNHEIFKNVLSLSETRIRECLIPRKEIVAVNINASVEEIKERFIETKLSKLVVFEDNIDNVRGYVHQLDMFKNPETLRSVLLPIPVIPTSMKATDLISKFTKERKSIAWVVDEFGGTAGIVTMEDLLEEIFGDINDEYDVQEEFVDKQIAPNEFLLSGRLELDYLQEKYKLEFRKNEDTETLSGYIINLHESIPRQRDRIIIDDYQFDILKVSETRIENVKLKILR
ncbi:MAG TPA: hemolysin family protein [Hanamia sp.]|jgi:CBS domain containing-hemolysin-like protein|nr:hemolysin family protein [Hanamia sp.]